MKIRYSHVAANAARAVEETAATASETYTQYRIQPDRFPRQTLKHTRQQKRSTREAQNRELLWIVITIAMMMVVGWLTGIGTGLGLTSALSAQPQIQAQGNVTDIPRRPDKGFRRKL